MTTAVLLTQQLISLGIQSHRNCTVILLRHSVKHRGTSGGHIISQLRGLHCSGTASMRAGEDGVAIVSAVRTPIGAFQGSLSSQSAQALGAAAIKAATQRIKLDATLIQEVIFGNVLCANLGQAPARQAARGAGLPDSVVCTTINKVCSSGLKAVAWAALQISSGLADVVVAGGMESMSNAPYYAPDARRGCRMGDSKLVDGMIKDGLWDPYGDAHMGSFGELCALEHNISRQEQDDHAGRSIQRARAAADKGLTAWEITPVIVSGNRASEASRRVDVDDGPWRKDAARLPSELGRFGGAGSVTAGNASPVSDGAAALVLMSGQTAAKLRLPVLAWIRGFGDAEKEPERFTTAPSLAIPKALGHAGLQLPDVDFFEINEAFSCVDIANRKLLGLPDSRVNVHGGAVAVGHPLGASGAVILVRLLNVLRCNNGRVGVAAICNGGGGASALVVECPPQAGCKL